MWPSLDDPAVRFGDETVTYGELLLIGAELDMLDSAADESQRAVQLLSSGAASPTREAVREAAVAFRLPRRLSSGEDLRRWLGERRLTTADLEGHLSRLLALETGATPPPGTIADPRGQRNALLVDLACSGWWGRVAREAQRLWSASRAENGRRIRSEDPAATDGQTRARLSSILEQISTLTGLGTLEPAWCADRLRLLRSRQGALVEVSRRIASAEAVDSRIVAHAADWTCFAFDVLALATRDAAREAVLCWREGDDPSEIARRAGSALECRDERKTTLSAPLASLLAGGRPGEALGPLEVDGNVYVLWLKERRAPSPSDPQLRKEASAELVAEALERAAGGRFEALGPL